MKSQSSLSITDDWVAGGNKGKTSFIEREKEAADKDEGDDGGSEPRFFMLAHYSRLGWMM